MSRILRVFLLTIAAASAAAQNSQPAMVRQIVIRAPRAEFVTAAMANPDDEALAKILWNWAANGKAMVARWYKYPTEMPTIPSAWEEAPSGTSLEIDPVFPRSMDFAFEHHPVPPRRAEWRCALDSPDLVMVQPQFIVRQIHSAMSFGTDGVALIGVTRTPDCNLGVPGLNANETLVIMARLDGGGVQPNHSQPAPKPDFSRLELEAVVFDLPAAEAAAWPEPSEGPADDSSRFAALLTRVDGGQVSIAAHVALGTSVTEPDQGRPPHRVSAVERVLSVTEIENNDSSHRYRPTAMKEIEAGTNLEVAAAFADSSIRVLADAAQFRISYTLRHDVAAPQEPDYRDVIASLDEKKNPGRNPPPAVVFEESWEGTVTVNANSTQFIGARLPPGEKMDGRIHAAFMRARLVE